DGAVVDESGRRAQRAGGHGDGDAAAARDVQDDTRIHGAGASIVAVCVLLLLLVSVKPAAWPLSVLRTAAMRRAAVRMRAQFMTALFYRVRALAGEVTSVTFPLRNTGGRASMECCRYGDRQPRGDQPASSPHEIAVTLRARGF